MFKTKLILIIGIVVILVGIGLYSGFYSQIFQKFISPGQEITPKEEISGEREISKGEPLPLELLEGEIQGIEYKIVRESWINDPIAKRRAYDVVTKKLDKENIEIVAGKIIKDINEEDPDIDHILLLFFTDKNLIETQSYDIAQVLWQPAEGGITPEIAEKNIRDNYKTYVIMARPEEE